MKIAILVFFILALLTYQLWGEETMDSVKMTIVFDNTSLQQNCTPEWGFACVIELPDETILFDTGNDGQILENNLKALGFENTVFPKIIISHMHWDHYGGLKRMLASNPDAAIYLPSTARDEDIAKFTDSKENIAFVKEPQEIAPYVYSLGEMPARANEHALAIRTKEGLVVVTGCAHPGIVEIVKKAREQFPEEKLKLVFGGFHLGGHSEAQVRDIVNELKALGVERAAPTHCTGEKSIAVFERELGDSFVRGGVGLRLAFELSDRK